VFAVKRLLLRGSYLESACVFTLFVATLIALAAAALSAHSADAREAEDIQLFSAVNINWQDGPPSLPKGARAGGRAV
jgi:hypothetical protein